MEIIVCLLTICFFTILEIRDLKNRAARASRPEPADKDFIVLPYYSKD